MIVLYLINYAGTYANVSWEITIDENNMNEMVSQFNRMKMRVGEVRSVLAKIWTVTLIYGIFNIVSISALLFYAIYQQRNSAQQGVAPEPALHVKKK